MNRFLGKAIVTGLGTGYLPIAPGTWGSAAVCGLYLLVAWAMCGSAVWATAVMAAVAVLASVGCVALGRFAEDTFGRKDPGACTIDEWAGQALALLLLPLGTTWQDRLIVAGAAFVAFRVFDIVKPPPAWHVQRLPHGWGVLLDDLFAGLYANIVCQLMLRRCYGLCGL